MIDYPSAHVTNHIYNSDDLKSPLDREQAMLKGIVLNDNSEKLILHLNLIKIF